MTKADREPWPYPPVPGYAFAPRNPTLLTVIGAVLLVASIGFFLLVIAWATGAVYIYSVPGQGVNAGTVVLTGLLPLAGAIVFGIGIRRLAWQRSYTRRHGVKPLIIGTRAWRKNQAERHAAALAVENATEWQPSTLSPDVPG